MTMTPEVRNQIRGRGRSPGATPRQGQQASSLLVGGDRLFDLHAEDRRRSLAYVVQISAASLVSTHAHLIFGSPRGPGSPISVGTRYKTPAISWGETSRTISTASFLWEAARFATFLNSSADLAIAH